MEVDIPVVAMTEVRQAHIPHADLWRLWSLYKLQWTGRRMAQFWVLHRFRLADMDKLSVMQWQ